MATYIPQISDQGLQTGLYTPDFSFLAANQQKKEQQYAQGLSEVASGYNAILNAPVTDNGNKAMKDQYAKTAQQGLKKLSTSDLSLPTNVAQAEALYAPFWQDNILLQDIAFTKYSQSELGKLDSWKNSKDEGIRSQYSADNQLWIQQGLEDFSNANRDPEVYKKLQKRSATPFYDIEADVNAAYKEEQSKGVDNVNTYGNTIVTEHNGIRSKDAFRTWYLSKVGSKYDQQLYITESVRVHQAKQEILRQNPGMDPRSLDEHFAGEQMSKLDRAYTGNIEAYNNIVKDWSKKYTDLYTQIQSQGGNMSPQDKANLDYFQMQIDANHKEADKYRNEYERYGSGDRNSENYRRTFTDITEHPEDYLAGIQKSIMADNWATGMSVMNTSTKVELNPGWKAYVEEADKAADRTLRQREIDATMRGQTLGLYEKTGTTTPGGQQDSRFNQPGYEGWIRKDGTIGADGTGIPNPASGSFIGPQTIDPANLDLKVSKVQEIQDAKMNTITNEIYSPTGIAAALGADGLDATTIINFTEGAKQGAVTGYMSPAQVTAWNEVKSVLKSNGIPTDDISGPKGMEQALLKYSAIAAGKLLNSGNVALVKQGRNLIKAYMDISGERDIVLANKTELDRVVKEEIATKPAYKKIRTTDGRIVTENDMQGDLIPLQLVTIRNHITDPTPHQETIDPKEFAKEHIAGKVSVTSVATTDGPRMHITIGDKEFLGPDPRSPNYAQQNAVINNFIHKYGTSSEFSGLVKQASAIVVPKLHIYDNGLIVQSMQYDPNIKGQEGMAVGVSKEVVNPANTDISRAYIEGGKPGENADMLKIVRNVVSSVEHLKKYTNGFHPTITPDGNRALAYTFKSNLPDTKIEGVDADKFEGKTFVIPVNPNSTTPVIKSIPWNEGSYIHNNLLYKSDPVVSDPIIQASGYRSVIHPYNMINGKNTKCSIVIEKAIPDPVEKGKTKWVTDATTTENLLVGDKAKNPDEITNIANYLLSQHLDKIVTNAEVKAQNTVNGTPVQK